MINQKEYKKEQLLKYKKTKKGVIQKIYDGQIQSSKKRNHLPPEYTKEELSNFLLNSIIFNNLFKIWEESNYLKLRKPSVDRLKYTDGYTFNNIQIVDWETNNLNHHKDVITGIDKRTSKKVFCYSLDNIFIKEYVSLAAAARELKLHYQLIANTCNKNQTQTGGYIFYWELLSQEIITDTGLEVITSNIEKCKEIECSELCFQDNKDICLELNRSPMDIEKCSLWKD